MANACTGNNNQRESQRAQIKKSKKRKAAIYFSKSLRTKEEEIDVKTVIDQEEDFAVVVLFDELSW